MHQNYIQYPPNSTGEKVATRRFDWVLYQNRTLTINTGDQISGLDTSDTTATGSVLQSREYAPGTGIIYFRFDNDDARYPFKDTADILISAVKVAEFSGNSVKHNIPASSIVDPINPMQAMRVDPLGQGFVRFREGSQLLDGVGITKVSQLTRLGNYCYANGENNRELQNILTGGGTIPFDSDQLATVLTCGTASGDKVSVTSNRYHTCLRGMSQLVHFLVAVGDNGKNNVSRRGGYFDDFNGVFFELRGQEMFIVVRSNTSGSVVDTSYPQTEWNGDRADGSGDLITNPSSVMFTPLNVGMYWMDIHYGARVRLGFYDSVGNRILGHTVPISNTSPLASFKSSHLPIKFEQENTGISASTSEFRLFGATVDIESQSVEKEEEDYNYRVNSVAITDTPKVILAIRPKLLTGSLANRKTARLDKLNTFLTGVTAGEACSIIVEGATSTSGGVWANHPDPNSSVMYNAAVTSYTAQAFREEIFIGEGASHLHIFQLVKHLECLLRLKADGTQDLTLVISAEMMTTGQSGTLTLSGAWKEFF